MTYFFSFVNGLFVFRLFFLFANYVCHVWATFLMRDTAKIHTVERERCTQPNRAYFVLLRPSFSPSPIYVRNFLVSLAQPPAVFSPSLLHSRPLLSLPPALRLIPRGHSLPGRPFLRDGRDMLVFFLGVGVLSSAEVGLHFIDDVNFSHVWASPSVYTFFFPFFLCCLLSLLKFSLSNFISRIAM